MITILLIVLEQALVHMPLILGSYISIALMKVPDLSLESAYVFGALCAAQTVIGLQGLSSSIQLTCVLSAAILGGALVGLTSSILTQKAGLPHLLSSILTAGMFHGINQLVALSYVSLTPFTNNLAVLAFVKQHPELCMLLIIGILSIMLVGLLLKTQLGCSFAIYGNNRSFLSNYGVSTPFVFISGIVTSNALAGLSGYLFAQTSGFAELNMGISKALLCITGLILGKTILQTTRAINIAVPLMGCLGYFGLQQLLLMVGFNLTYFTMIQSLIVLAILIANFKKSDKRIDHLGV